MAFSWSLPSGSSAPCPTPASGPSPDVSVPSGRRRHPPGTEAADTSVVDDRTVDCHSVFGRDDDLEDLALEEPLGVEPAPEAPSPSEHSQAGDSEYLEPDSPTPSDTIPVPVVLPPEVLAYLMASDDADPDDYDDLEDAALEDAEDFVNAEDFEDTEALEEGEALEDGEALEHAHKAAEPAEDPWATEQLPVVPALAPSTSTEWIAVASPGPDDPEQRWASPPELEQLWAPRGEVPVAPREEPDVSYPVGGASDEVTSCTAEEVLDSVTSMVPGSKAQERNEAQEVPEETVVESLDGALTTSDEPELVESDEVSAVDVSEAAAEESGDDEPELPEQAASSDQAGVRDSGAMPPGAETLGLAGPAALTAASTRLVADSPDEAAPVSAPCAGTPASAPSADAIGSAVPSTAPGSAQPGPGGRLPRSVLVTGASRGIGHAVAKALLEAGDKVVGVSRSGKAPEGAVALAADVTDPEELRRAVSQAEEVNGPIEVLVACAGESRDSLAARTSEPTWEAMLDTNLTGTFHTVRSVLPQMMRARSGRIVLVSSVIASRGGVGQAAYGASKAGVEGLVRSLARELAPRGITVNAVAPGFVSTDMTHRLPDVVRSAHVAATPIGRLATVEEIAAPVMFLASEEASYITGVVLPVDGGIGMGR